MSTASLHTCVFVGNNTHGAAKIQGTSRLALTNCTVPFLTALGGTTLVLDNASVPQGVANWNITTDATVIKGCPAGRSGRQNVMLNSDLPFNLSPQSRCAGGTSSNQDFPEWEHCGKGRTEVHRRRGWKGGDGQQYSKASPITIEHGDFVSCCPYCAEGTSAASASSLSCLTCPGGKHSSASSGSTACVDCAAGRFSFGGVASCTACSNGSIAATEGQLSCEPCSAGYHADAARTSCLACAPGTYSLGGVDDCISCEAGQYTSAANFPCVDCISGMFTNASKQAACQECELRVTYQNASGQSICKACTTCAAGRRSTGQPSLQQNQPCEDCSEGRVSAAEASACTSCPAGKREDGTHTSCVDCEAGTYSLGGTASCVGCEPGRATSVDGTQPCADCPAGTFGSASNQVACMMCVPGTTYQNTTGAIVCKTCSSCPVGQHIVGQASRQQDNQCSRCVAGTFSNTTNAAACITCALGSTFQDEVGATRCRACATCAAGQFSVVSCAAQADTTCSACAPGSYSHAGNTMSSCIGCPTGRYQTQGEQASCLMCDSCTPGNEETTACTPTSKRECAACQPGAYQNASNQASCITCKEGNSFQNQTSGTSCKPCGTCPQGRFIVVACTARTEMVCSDCLGGTYSAVAQSQSCIACPSGFLQPMDASTNCTTCTQCRPGALLVADCTPTTEAICVATVAGTFTNTTDQKTAFECSEGHTFQDESGAALCKVCTVCPAGHIRVVAPTIASDRKCAACSPGQYSRQSNSARCLKCPPGYATNMAQSPNCTACQPGMFEPLEAQPQCSTCPMGTLGVVHNATSIDACTPCDPRSVECNGAALIIKAGFSRGAQLFDNISKVPLPECRNYLGLKGFGRDDRPLATCVTSQPYYRALECPIRTACRRVEFANATQGLGCVDGTRGDRPLCSVCIRGFYRKDDACVRCEVDAEQSTASQQFLLACLLIVVAQLGIVKLITTPTKPERSASLDTLADAECAIVLSFLDADASGKARVDGYASTCRAIAKQVKKVNLTTTQKLRAERIAKAKTLAKEANEATKEIRNAQKEAKRAQRAATTAVESNAHEKKAAAAQEETETTSPTPEKEEVDAGEDGLAVGNDDVVVDFATHAFLSAWDEGVNTVKLIIGFLQVTSLSGLSFDIPWPPFFTRLQNVFAWPSNILDISTFTRPFVIAAASLADKFKALQCQQAAIGFGTRFIIHVTVLPLLATLLILGLMAAKFLQYLARRHEKATKKKKKKKKQTKAGKPARTKPSFIERFGAKHFTMTKAMERAIGAMNSAIFLIYPGLGLRVVRSFKCVPVYGRSYLEADMGIECQTPGHSLLLSMAAVTLVIVVIGVPFFYACVIFAARRDLVRDADTGKRVVITWTHDGILERGFKSKLDSAAFQDRWGNLVRAYDRDYAWMESIELLRKFVLTGGLVLLPAGSTTQLFLATLVAFFYVCFVMYAKPLKDADPSAGKRSSSGLLRFLTLSPDGMLEMVQIQIFLTMLCGLMLKTSLPLPGSLESAIFDVLLTLTQLVVIAMGMYALAATLGKKLFRPFHAVCRCFGKKRTHAKIAPAPAGRRRRQTENEHSPLRRPSGRQTDGVIPTREAGTRTEQHRLSALSHDELVKRVIQAERQIKTLRLDSLDSDRVRKRDEEQARQIITLHEEEVQASRRQLKIQRKTSQSLGQSKLLKRRMRSLFKAMAETFDGLPDDAIVAALDRDADGEITYEELLQSIRENAVTFKGREIGDDDVRSILSEMDKDASGSVSVAELLSALRSVGTAGK